MKLEIPKKTQIKPAMSHKQHPGEWTQQLAVTKQTI